MDAVAIAGLVLLATSCSPQAADPLRQPGPRHQSMQCLVQVVDFPFGQTLDFGLAQQIVKDHAV